MRFFGVNFILQKFCLCKKNDKYQVWCQDISGGSLNLSEEIPHRTCLGLPNLGHPHLHLRANSSKAQHLYGCCQVLRKTLQTNEGYHKL